MSATRLSSRGQIVIPAEIRKAHGWRPGRVFEVIDTPEGVLLRPKPLFPPAKLEDVTGILKYDGPPKTIEEMDEAITEEVRQLQH